MFHFFEAITNKKGDALTGYFVKAIDTTSLGVVDIYADENLTPIVSVSNVANAAEVDTDGNVSFFVAGGTYHLDIYATDATTFVRRISNLPMVDLGANTTNNVANVATRTALAAVTGAVAGTTRYLTESGREGQFVWSSANLSAKVTADTAQGVYVPPASATTGASGAWVRKYPGPLNVRWFGAAGDGSTNDSAAFLAAIAVLNLTTSGNIGFGSAVASLYVPQGTYFLSTTKLVFNNAIAIYGDGGGTFGGLASILKWSAGTIGLEFLAQNWFIDGLALQGGWVDSTTAEGEYHAIHAKYKGGWGKLYITNWQGDGLHVDTATDGGNCNGMYGRSLTANLCRSGVDITGADANAGDLGFIDANANRRAGIRDDSAYGNNYVALQTSGNGVQGVASTAPVCVFNNGHVFTVAKGQATGASTNSPPATATSNTWWIYWKDVGAATAYAPQWVSGTTYRDGGAILVTGASNSTTVGHLYTESDQPPVQMEQSSLSVGGKNAAGLEASTRRIFADSNGINLSTKARVNGDFTITGLGKVQASGTAQATLYLQNDTGTATNLIFNTGNGATPVGSIVGSTGNGMLYDSVSGATHYFSISGSNRVAVNNGGLFIFNGYSISFNGTPITDSATGRILAAGFPALTGDVTTAGGSLATTLSSATVVAKIAGQAIAPSSSAATGAITSSSASAGIGYATGAGGTVTQITSRTTGVTLNKIVGEITLVSAAGSATYQSFTVTNSSMAATDNVILNQKSGTDKYILLVTNKAAGSFQITFATTGGTTTETPVLSFEILKGVAA